MRLVRQAGLEPVEHRLLRLAPPADPEPLLRAAGELSWLAARSVHEESLTEPAGMPAPAALWLVLTSKNALPPLLDALEESGCDPRLLPGAGMKVAAVGPATAEALSAAGLPPDLVPAESTGEGLLEALSREHPVRVLLPRAEEAREVLPEGLRELGVQVQVVPAYRIAADHQAALGLARAVVAGEVDVVAFTSGSAVRAFARGWRDVGRLPPAEGGKWPGSVQVAVIGRVTGQAVTDEGFEASIQPSESTLEALVRAIAEAKGTDARGIDIDRDSDTGDTDDHGPERAAGGPR